MTIKLVEVKAVSVKGLTRDEATDLLIDNGYKSAGIKSFLKTNSGLLKVVAKGGTFQAVLDYLGEKDRTGKEFADFVLDKSTLNEQRWFSNREIIRNTLVKVRGDKNFKDVPATPEQLKKFADNLKAAADKAKAEKAKK